MVLLSFTWMHGVRIQSAGYKGMGLRVTHRVPGAGDILCASGRMSAVCASAREEAGGQRTGHLCHKRVFYGSGSNWSFQNLWYLEFIRNRLPPEMKENQR